MKWIVILLIAAAAVWAYFNADFSNVNQENTKNTIKKEKTMKKFFSADEQNKQELQKVLEEY